MPSSWLTTGVPDWFKKSNLTPIDRLSYYPQINGAAQIPNLTSFGTEAGSRVPLSSGPSQIPSGFNLADSFGSGLIGSGGIKLFSQALKELFGGKSKTEKPKTLSEAYLEAYNAAKAARVPSRYLKDALEGK